MTVISGPGGSSVGRLVELSHPELARVRVRLGEDVLRPAIGIQIEAQYAETLNFPALTKR